MIENIHGFSSVECHLTPLMLTVSTQNVLLCSPLSSVSFHVHLHFTWLREWLITLWALYELSVHRPFSEQPFSERRISERPFSKRPFSERPINERPILGTAKMRTFSECDHFSNDHSPNSISPNAIHPRQCSFQVALTSKLWIQINKDPTLGPEPDSKPKPDPKLWPDPKFWLDPFAKLWPDPDSEQMFNRNVGLFKPHISPLVKS
jgi:hypothetical protein